MRVTILGKSGQVAQCLADRAPAQIETSFLGRDGFDLAQPSFDFSVLSGTAPDLVINAAAYTAVDKAESDLENARLLNADAPARIAEFCLASGIPLIHISTDYVFNGQSDQPYLETASTAPISVYGWTKVAGEEDVRRILPQHLIFRTSWVYSPYGQNFVKTMLRLAGERGELSIVADQIGKPTSAYSLADAIWTAANHIRTNASADVWGLYHYADADAVSWAVFAEMIFAEAEQSVKVTYIPTTDYPTPAARPLRSILDCSKFEARFGMTPPPLKDSLRNVIRQLQAEAVT